MKKTSQWNRMLPALTVLVALPVLEARAAILAFEDFGTRTDGTLMLSNGDGTGWATNWSGDSPGNQYLNSGTNFSGATNIFSQSTTSYASIGNHRIGRDLDTSGSGAFGLAGYLDGSGNIGLDGTTLYVAWAMKVSPSVHYYGFEFHRDDTTGGTGDNERHLQISTDGAGSGNDLNLRANGSGGSAVMSPDDANINYFVLKLTFGTSDNDTAGIFLNPALNSAEGAPTASVTATNLSFDRIALASFVSNPVLDVDNIRFGTTYADVVGAVPEPSTSGLLLGGLAALCSCVRRKKADTSR